MKKIKCFTLSCKSFRSNLLTALLRSRMSRFSLTKFRSLAAHLYGFTLAEVLITLAILGVVAAIMIPSTMQRVTDRQTVAAVKRAYSLIENALQMSFVIHGDPNQYLIPNGSSDSYSNPQVFVERFNSFLAYSKSCGAPSSDNNCFGDIGDVSDSTFYKVYKNLRNEIGNQYMSVNGAGVFNGILKNGMFINIQNIHNRPYLGGFFCIFRVDINGKRGPNRYGYDVFFFPATNKGIINNQTPGITSDYYGFHFTGTNRCNKSNTSVDVQERGVSCAEWIVKHNNMDYKYRDVSSEW